MSFIQDFSTPYLFGPGNKSPPTLLANTPGGGSGVCNFQYGIEKNWMRLIFRNQTTWSENENPKKWNLTKCGIRTSTCFSIDFFGGWLRWSLKSNMNLNKAWNLNQLAFSTSSLAFTLIKEWKSKITCISNKAWNLNKVWNLTKVELESGVNWNIVWILISMWALSHL